MITMSEIDGIMQEIAAAQRALDSAKATLRSRVAAFDAIILAYLEARQLFDEDYDYRPQDYGFSWDIVQTGGEMTSRGFGLAEDTIATEPMVLVTWYQRFRGEMDGYAIAFPLRHLTAPDWRPLWSRRRRRPMKRTTDNARKPIGPNTRP